MDTKEAELLKMRTANKAHALWLAAIEGKVTDQGRVDTDQRFFDINKILNELIEQNYQLTNRCKMQDEILTRLVNSIEILALEVGRLSR